MTWLISKALMTAYENSPCSRALVEEFSAASCSDGELSALSSGESTPQAYCAPDKMTAFSRLSRFGMTFKPLTENLGAELLTWYLGVSRAKTSALPEKVQASPESDQVCGPTWRGSLAKYDPVSLSWKTVQLCLLGDSELSSVIWPRSGMTACGECWELPMLERTIKGTGSGLWQTPVADDLVNRKDGKWNSRGEPKLSAQVMQWPTPNAMYATNDLTLQCSGDGRKKPNKLGWAMAESGETGLLNPTWVEWLMGWPLGWTDLKPSVTGKLPSALQQHGECLEGQ